MGIDRGQLDWVFSDGGPLLLLGQEQLASWRGSDPPGTDYRRACSVNDYVGLIGVNGGQGLVLGDVPMQTAWWPNSATEGILVRWDYAEDEAHLIPFLRCVPADVWPETDLALTVSSARLYLFDSAYPGAELGDHLVIRLPPGSYTIATGLYHPDGETSLVLHRLRGCR